MKEMIRFSLIRRFNNKSTKVFNILVFLLIAILVFSDETLKIINPSMFEKEIVYVINIDKEVMQYLESGLKENYDLKSTNKSVKKLTQEGNMVLEKKKNAYVLYSKYEAQDKMNLFALHLDLYQKEQFIKNEKNLEVIMGYNKEVKIKNVVSKKEIDVTNEKSNVIFMFVTSIYFMMISFISTVASEVVNEKATKTLELLLTSVSAKTHFYAKLLVGWLTIVIQGFLSLSYILFWLLLRSMHDQGKGLIKLINTFNLFHIKGKTFYSVLSNLDLSLSFFAKLIWILLFVLLGVFLVQLVMVIVSSFVSSIEEAGNIQAPFYLILLGFYYVTLALNNVHDLNEGIGFYLSFIPFFNMLLMPCRLLMGKVSLIHLIISMTASICLILFVLHKGIPVYERGVLDYSCKGFMQVLQSVYPIKIRRINLKEKLLKYVNEKKGT